ncbi:uncharacterized protein [Hoplias malabaricus]|uniref:uncharacterized protein n=1 Tax=Hoplias malabaricus TaxID=27720 RepID=UPI0034632C64
MIKICRQRHGSALTDQLKGCVAENCEEDLLQCVEWFLEGFKTIGMDSIPPSFPETYRHHNEWVMGKVLLSMYNCFSDYDDDEDVMELMECIMNDILRKSEPSVKILSWIVGFSKPGLLLCWLKNTLKVGFSCFYDLDEDYSTLLDNNTKYFQTHDLQEYSRCHMMIFKDKKCFQLFSQIFGSTPEMLTQSKGLFICMINALVLATAEC